MAAQTITVTTAAPTPAAITLAADVSCLHLSGAPGARGLLLTVSPDGVLPYVPLSQIRDVGEFARLPGVYAVSLKAGWRLKAAASTAGENGVDATVAVE